MNNVNVFIGYSGKKSKEVAKSLYDWIPLVIQRVDPWMASQDIPKGVSWVPEIKCRLRQAHVYLVCLTRDNINELWLSFEAGGAWVNDRLICPYLLDLEPADLELPLSDFNAAKADRDDTRKLLDTINRTLENESLSAKVLEAEFNEWWPKLDKRLKKIQATGLSLVDKRNIPEMAQQGRERVRQPTGELSTLSPTTQILCDSRPFQNHPNFV